MYVDLDVYVPMSRQSRLGLGAYHDVIRKRRARVAWLHGLCPRVLSRGGYMVCARVTWLHGLRPCAGRVVTWFARWTATAATSW